MSSHMINGHRIVILVNGDPEVKRRFLDEVESDMDLLKDTPGIDCREEYGFNRRRLGGETVVAGHFLNYMYKGILR